MLPSAECTTFGERRLPAREQHRQATQLARQCAQFLRQICTVAGRLERSGGHGGRETRPQEIGGRARRRVREAAPVAVLRRCAYNVQPARCPDFL